MNTETQSLDEQYRQAFSIATMEEYKQYKSKYNELGEFIHELQTEWYTACRFLDADWTDIGDYLESDDFDNDYSVQHLRRTLVRTLFAMIEGITFAHKQKILADYEAGRRHLSHAEYAILTEESYQLRDSGTIRTSPNYPNIQANIKFVFPLYARILDSEFTFDPPLSAPGWQSLCRSIEIRNRLMHPKSLTDLDVTDTDLEEVEKAAEWFTAQIDRLESLFWHMLMQRSSEIQGENQTTSSDPTQEPPDD
ncbi:MAG: hypothetical protein ACP5J4_15755 [Anaerolineae bacterium]